MFPLKFEINYGEICEKSSKKSTTKKVQKKKFRKKYKKKFNTNKSHFKTLLENKLSTFGEKENISVLYTVCNTGITVTLILQNYKIKGI